MTARVAGVTQGAVLCEPKSVEQVSAIAVHVAQTGARTLFTRVRPEQAAAVLAALPDAEHHVQASLVAWPPEPPTSTVVW